MRGRTLAEKRYGPGIRPGLLRKLRAPWPGCAVELPNGKLCTSEVAGTLEMYVDDHPPGIDWYSKLLRKLPVGVYVNVRLCLAHLEETCKLSIQVQEDPDGWAPGRENPHVLINPPHVYPKAAALKGWEVA